MSIKPRPCPVKPSLPTRYKLDKSAPARSSGHREQQRPQAGHLPGMFAGAGGRPPCVFPRPGISERTCELPAVQRRARPSMRKRDCRTRGQWCRHGLRARQPGADRRRGRRCGRTRAGPDVSGRGAGCGRGCVPGRRALPATTAGRAAGCGRRVATAAAQAERTRASRSYSRRSSPARAGAARPPRAARASAAVRRGTLPCARAGPPPGRAGLPPPGCQTSRERGRPGACAGRAPSRHRRRHSARASADPRRASACQAPGAGGSFPVAKRIQQQRFQPGQPLAELSQRLRRFVAQLAFQQRQQCFDGPLRARLTQDDNGLSAYARRRVAEQTEQFRLECLRLQSEAAQRRHRQTADGGRIVVQSDDRGGRFATCRFCRGGNADRLVRVGQTSQQRPRTSSGIGTEEAASDPIACTAASRTPLTSSVKAGSRAASAAAPCSASLCTAARRTRQAASSSAWRRWETTAGAGSGKVPSSAATAAALSPRDGQGHRPAWAEFLRRTVAVAPGCGPRSGSQKPGSCSACCSSSRTVLMGSPAPGGAAATHRGERAARRLPCGAGRGVAILRSFAPVPRGQRHRGRPAWPGACQPVRGCAHAR